MKKLLNTLYAMSEDIYLSLDGENAVANRDKQELARYPLHTLQSIVSFSYAGLSPALMGECAKRGIGVALCSPRGRFLVRVCGEINGNVLLRRTQYRAADDEAESCRIARCMIFGKLYNSRWSIERTKRDHGMRVDAETLSNASGQIKELLPRTLDEASLDGLRGLEGNGANAYFGVLDQLILNDKGIFSFNGRSRRPPLDPVNAMLSFAYSILAHDCASALEAAGLDPYVGINNRVMDEKVFIRQESGAVLLNDDGRRKFFKHWQDKKRESLTHAYLGDKLQWGMVPYIQEQLLARYLRGDLDDYPPFLWK